MTHILSVDVEDYFQVEAFRDVVRREEWERWPVRVGDNTRRVLDLFDEFGVKATFFTVGWVAEKDPALIADIDSRGHELACHSYWHRTVYSLSPDEFREDTRTARDRIEQITGKKILGYRAPSWSVTRQSMWALDVLAELGFEYDSSIFPIHHDIYGVPGASRFAHVRRCANGMLLREFPPTTVRLAGMEFPAAGGGYLRILPVRFTNWAFRQIEAERQPVVVYFHPWELDPEQPRIPGARLRSRVRHYTNLSRMQDRIRLILKEYRFQPFREALLGQWRNLLQEASPVGANG